MKQLTKEEAIALAETRWWESRSDEDIFHFQMNQKCLCMPFDSFHRAVEGALKRPVWTHEFMLNWQGLLDEFVGGSIPSMEDIINLIPKEKLIILTTDVD